MINNKMTGAKTEKIKRKRNGGFTMVETLVTTAIIIILLAIGIVSVLRYRDYLKITELDNMARSIYMAAQNRVVLLDNDRRFQTLVKKTQNTAPDGTYQTGFGEVVSASGKKYWYIDSKGANPDVLSDLLPTGTIDSALRGGRFYIVYETESASVTDVFYMAKQDYDLASEFTDGIKGALEELGADDKRNDRMNNKKDGRPAMVGWFGSNAAAARGGQLDEPSVMVEIENGDELTLKVTYEYTLPEGTSGVTPETTVTVQYGTPEHLRGEIVKLMNSEDLSSASLSPIVMPNGGILSKSEDVDSISHSVKYTYIYNRVLDSLAGNHFKNLGSGGENPGGDFTVTADLTLTADDGATSYADGYDTDNSLFATDTHDSDTAFIDNLRHLQNLHTAHSGVKNGITKAKQRATEIDASKVLNNEGVVKNPSYEFRPIENTALSCYEDMRTNDVDRASAVSDPYSITNLNVTAASATGTGAGLFGKVENNFVFWNVRLENPSVTGGGKPAGGLVGNAAGEVSFRNCQVVGNTSANTVTGSIAGGLAGKTGKANFELCTDGDDNKKNCSAEDVTVTATTSAGGLVGESAEASFTACQVFNAVVKGSDSAGGMLGYSEGSAVEFITCDIKELEVEGSSAGGLLGHKKNKNVTFTSCTAGQDDKEVKINGSSNAGGLLGYVEKEAATSATATFTECTVGKADGTAKNVTVTTATGSAGGMAGKSDGSCSFNGCQVVNAEVTGTGAGSIAGGMAGKTNGATFAPYSYPAVEGTISKNCTVKNVMVKAIYIAGGMTGHNGGTAAASFTMCEVVNTTVSDGKEGETIGSDVNCVAGGMMGADESTAADGSKFENCGIESVTVNSTNKSAGGMLGWKKNAKVTFTSCTAGQVDGSIINISGKENVGGLLGYTEGSTATFTDCTVGKADGTAKNVSVETTTGIAGGMAGHSNGGDFQGCQIVNAEVTGTDAGSIAGGLVGKTNGATFALDADTGKKCTVTSVIVIAKNCAGGMAGHNEGTAAASFTMCEVVNTTVSDGKKGETIGSDVNCVVGGMMGADESTATDGSKFENCEIESVTVNSTNKSAGGMLGWKKNAKVTFTSCTAGQVDGSIINISGKENVGGLLGYTEGSTATFTECTVGKAADTANVTAATTDKNVTVETTTGIAGGMVGKMGSDCLFYGCQAVNIEVKGTEAGSIAGGLAGNTIWTVFDTAEGDTMKKCTVENVTVKARQYAGGMAGNIDGGKFNKCETANAEVLDTGEGGVLKSYAGGLVGNAGSTEFIDCIVGQAGEIIITANGLAGGLAGSAGGSFIRCETSKATVEGKNSGSYAGGLVGDTGAAQFTECKVGKDGKTTVTAANLAGGLVGNKWGDGNFYDCQIFEAAVTSTENLAGGLVGFSWGSTISFEKCKVKGLTLKGENNSAGGLIGSKSAGCVKFTGCTVGQAEETTSVITGKGSAGGLLGYTADNCKAEFNGCQIVNITINGNAAGGLAGQSVGSQFIGCTAEGNENSKKIIVTALYYGGGLVGDSTDDTYEGCKAVNVKVTGNSEYSIAGGLVGRLVSNSKEEDKILIDKCRVYQDSNQKGEITAGVAGGLVGEIINNGKIQQSFAATFVRGTVYAGGLVGHIDRKKDKDGHIVVQEGVPLQMAVETSYADCDIKAGKEGLNNYPYAGGLLGLKEGAIALTLKNVYAAGFIEMAGINQKNAAGLCAGYVDANDSNQHAVNASYAYAAMTYTNVNVALPLASNVIKDNNCYYLDYPGKQEWETYFKSYEEMRSINMGSEFVSLPETHRYGLSDNASSESTYSFPGLKDLPHYGDWVSKEAWQQQQNTRAVSLFALEEDVSGNDIPSVSNNDIPSVSDNNVQQSSVETSVDSENEEESENLEESKESGEGGIPGENENPEEGENPDKTPIVDPENPQTGDSVPPPPEVVVPPEITVSGETTEGGEGEGSDTS